MSEIYGIFGQMTLPPSATCTSATESQGGPMPLGLQDGQMTALYSQPRSHANLSPGRAKELGLLTKDTSGPRGAGSSNSVNLTRSLASKYRLLTDSRGSMLFRLTWKIWATPWGRLVPLQRALAHHILGNDSSSWATPKASDGSGGRTTETKGGGNIHLDKQARLVGWRTPNALDGERGRRLHPDKKAGQHSLTTEVHQVAGPTPNGSPVETENIGQLNAAFPRFLLGYPEAWDKCSPDYQDWGRWELLSALLSQEPDTIEGEDSAHTEIPLPQK